MSQSRGIPNQVWSLLLIGFCTMPLLAGGVITTIAGQGSPGGDFGDGGLAIDSHIKDAEGVGVDAAGNIYIADTDNSRIRRIDAVTGIITTIAGLGKPGGYSGDGGLATAAKVKNPEGLFVDAAGDIYIGDTGNNRIRKIDGSTGIITTIAGTGSNGSSGDGGPAVNAKLKGPTGLFVDSSGTVFIADTGNHKIRKVDGSTGIITLVAGGPQWGDTGDGGLAINAKLKQPQGVCVDSDGNLIIADTDNNKLRRVDGITGIISSIAGLGPSQGGDAGEGGPATAARLKGPESVSLDVDGNFYICDTSNNKIKRIDKVTGIITTIAGISGSGGDSGDGGPPTAAEMKSPTSIAWLLDDDGKTYHIIIADSGNSKIRRATSTRIRILTWREIDPLFP